MLSKLLKLLCPFQTQFQALCKTIRPDNGLEFAYTEAMLFSSPKGLFTKRVRHLNKMVSGEKAQIPLGNCKSSPLQSKFPLKYWGECILTETYIINRLPLALFITNAPLKSYTIENLRITISGALAVFAFLPSLKFTETVPT